MSDSSYARQFSLSPSQCFLSDQASLRVIVESTSSVGRSGRVCSYFDIRELVQILALLPICSVPNCRILQSK
jgi:hypothetical protein